MAWKKLKRKGELEEFIYTGGDCRWDALAIDEDGNWAPFVIGKPKPEDAIAKVDKGKILIFALSRKKAKERVRELEERYNDALRAQELRNEKI